MNPAVSIITATYNQSEYIAQCIESVLGQTFPDWEMIVIDDSSDDQTVRLASSYDDRRIQVVTNSHRRGLEGLADTYNEALSRADGEHIAILEGDDFWPPEKLQTVLPLFDDPEVVLAYGLTQQTTTAGEVLNKYIPDPRRWDEMSVLSNNPLGSASLVLAEGETFCFPVATMIRTSTLREIGGFRSWPGLNFVDQPTFLRLSVEGKFAFVPEVAGFWRQRMGSGTRTRDEIAVAQAMSAAATHFFEKHSASMAVPLPSLDQIQTHHLRSARALLLTTGRIELLKGEFASARRTFLQVLKDREATFDGRFRAFAGVVFSWLHRDVEWIVRLLKGRDADMRWIFSTATTNDEG